MKQLQSCHISPYSNCDDYSFTDDKNGCNFMETRFISYLDESGYSSYFKNRRDQANYVKFADKYASAPCLASTLHEPRSWFMSEIFNEKLCRSLLNNSCLWHHGGSARLPTPSTWLILEMLFGGTN